MEHLLSSSQNSAADKALLCAALLQTLAAGWPASQLLPAVSSAAAALSEGAEDKKGSSSGGGLACVDIDIDLQAATLRALPPVFQSPPSSAASKTAASAADDTTATWQWREGGLLAIELLLRALLTDHARPLAPAAPLAAMPDENELERRRFNDPRLTYFG